MGDEFNICVADEEVESGGGVNVAVPSALLLLSSIMPRCLLAVRLSDAFCFRITRLEMPVAA